MFRQLKTALVLLAILTVITGVVYPLAVTALAQVFFPSQAGGSLVWSESEPVGSAVIGQANNDPRYFWPRPSATDYNTLPSGGSNLSPASGLLAEQAGQRAAKFRAANGLPADSPVPAEMLFASASGLDPHIGPEAARLQIGRVAAARGLNNDVVAALVEQFVEGPQLGILGQPRVNVLLLNLALDDLE